MSNTAKRNSSDSTFYLVMLAAIVAMGFYISDDMGKRYGSKEGAADSNITNEQNQTAQPVIVNIEKVISVEVKPMAEIPAGEAAPEAVVVEKTVQEMTTTTAIVPVADIKDPQAASKPISTVEVTKPAATDPAVQLEDSVKTIIFKPVKSAIESIPVESATTAVEAASAMMADPVPVRQAVQQYQQYQQYSQPYQGYQGYQPQPYQGQGGNYYQQPYSNPYNNNPYGNPYDSGYNPGYNSGYNSYQQ